MNGFPIVNYDRSQPTLRLRVTVRDGRPFDVEVANPMIEPNVAEWKPEPLPQTRHVAGLDVILRSVSVKDDSRNPPKIVPEFVVRDSTGAEQRWGDLDGLVMETKLQDARGNVAALANGSRLMYEPLPFSASAWKIEAKVWRNKDFNFPAEEGLTLSPAPMPAAGKASAFTVPESAAKEGLRAVVLVGSGRFVWDEMTLTETGLTVKEARAADVRDRVRDWTRLVTTDDPLLLVLVEPQDHAKWLGVEKESQVRYVRQYLKSRSVALDEGSPQPFTLKSGKQVVVRKFSFRWENPPPAGTPVPIQIIPHLQETIEFLFAPPPAPEGR
jgi:hypothetical protein